MSKHVRFTGLTVALSILIFWTSAVSAQDCRALRAVGESSELATLYHNTKRGAVSTKRAIEQLEAAIKGTYPKAQQKRAADEVARKAHTAISLIETGVALTSKSGADAAFLKVAAAWGVPVTPHGLIAIVAWKGLKYIGDRGGVTGAQRRQWLLHALAARKSELGKLQSAAEKIFQTMVRAKREYQSRCQRARPRSHDDFRSIEISRPQYYPVRSSTKCYCPVMEKVSSYEACRGRYFFTCMHNGSVVTICYEKGRKCSKVYGTMCGLCDP